MKRILVTGILGAIALLGAGCGIPVSSSPHLLPVSELPASLVEQQSQPAPERSTSSRVETVYIYLVDDVSGDLVKTPRTVVRPATVQEVLDAIEVGPLSEDYRLGDESAVNTNSHLVSEAPVAHGTATVRLDHDFYELHGEAPVDELAQIVWSLAMSDLGVSKVRFVDASGPVAVETDTGRFVNRPVMMSDYAGLVQLSTG